VAQMLGLPRSSTQTTVTRVRPALYIVERRELSKQKDKAKKPLPPGLNKFIVTVEASVLARDEQHALRRFATVLGEKLAGQPGRHFKIDIAALTEAAAGMSAMEQVETYQPRNFIGGMRKP